MAPRSPTPTAAARPTLATCSTCSAGPRRSSSAVWPRCLIPRPAAAPLRRERGVSPSGASQLARLTGLAVREARVVGSQHGYQHLMVTLAGGKRAFAKVAAGTPGTDEIAAAFAAEANGLRWLAEAKAVPVPELLAAESAALVISMVQPGQATPEAAFRFGTELARLHAAGADRFGAPWRGFIASLPLDNTGGPSWPEWYASRRLLPYLRLAIDAGALRPADGRLVEAVMDRIPSPARRAQPPRPLQLGSVVLGRRRTAAGGKRGRSRALGWPAPAVPRSRIHGDCWAGNVLW